jgi:hypothetical protein
MHRKTWKLALQLISKKFSKHVLNHVLPTSHEIEPHIIIDPLTALQIHHPPMVISLFG